MNLNLHNKFTTIVILLAIIAAVSFGDIHVGYDAYTDWQNWSQLRLGIDTYLASSYDRTGLNNDFSQYESPEGLMLEEGPAVIQTIPGPGVIHRFWMPHLTAEQSFLVRIYFDDEPTPRIDTYSNTLLDGSYSYMAAPLVNTCAGGQVSYEPIYFQNSLRIETVNKPIPPDQWSRNRHYYQYSYSTLPANTTVPDYTGTLTTAQQQQRDALVNLWQNVGQHPAGTSTTSTILTTSAQSIDPCNSLVLADVTGPGLVRRLNINIDPCDNPALQGLRLRVYYDTQPNPAIDVAVGLFFGAGNNRALYTSLPLGTDSPDGFYCYWPMPFADALRVELYNAASQPLSIDGAKLEYESQPIDRRDCYLHALESSSLRQSTQIYHNILNVTGQGHYVGELLYLDQDSYSFGVLEGDEVITVDGQRQLLGTGLEDAYNGGYYYNWVGVRTNEPEGGYPQSATRPLNGILYVHRELGVEYARADQYRWRIADAVAFTNSIDVKIENRYGIYGARFTSVAFYYQLPHSLADLNADGAVNTIDLAVLAANWLQQNCDTCNQADLTGDNQVNIQDFAAFTAIWTNE
ncbi:MAG: DUF2961 domain-containing protein [Sedimentisphaerales bacterium]|nr:DUF2961 domain-containing protein [Sedimentisphaerales bacterium]